MRLPPACTASSHPRSTTRPHHGFRTLDGGLKGSPAGGGPQDGADHGQEGVKVQALHAYIRAAVRACGAPRQEAQQPGTGCGHLLSVQSRTTSYWASVSSEPRSCRRSCSARVRSSCSPSAAASKAAASTAPGHVKPHPRVTIARGLALPDNPLSPSHLGSVGP